MLTVAIATPLILTSSTAVVLPMMGIQVPRLGPASFAILGAILMWTYYRFGFSAFAPGTFSAELVEMLPVGVCLLDPNGRVLRANETMAKLAGVEVGTLSGAEIARLIEGIGRPNEILTDAECGLTPLAGQTTEIPVAVSTSAICDRRGLHLGSALVVRDLREMVRLRRHLVTSGRMAAVGELAAGIAHEINNPMAYVQANLSHLERLWRGLDPWLPVRGSNAELDALRDDVREMLDESLEGVERTSAIVRDVKSFAHAGTGEVESVELDSLLKDVLRVAEPQFRYSAKVRFEGGGVPAIKGRPQELKQVFLNLVMNAVQAVAASGGSVWVRTRLEDSHVVVEVEDDGSGIRREDFDRIFDPFFTTKPVGEGTGLGLAISHEIVLGHGAEIFVDSVQDRWTKFTVRFDCDPAAEDST
jgi:signal transduction histidine kinase